jgi:hypothetical protein
MGTDKKGLFFRWECTDCHIMSCYLTGRLTTIPSIPLTERRKGQYQPERITHKRGELCHRKERSST